MIRRTRGAALKGVGALTIACAMLLSVGSSRSQASDLLEFYISTPVAFQGLIISPTGPVDLLDVTFVSSIDANWTFTGVVVEIDGGILPETVVAIATLTSIANPAAVFPILHTFTGGTAVLPAFQTQTTFLPGGGAVFFTSSFQVTATTAGDITGFTWTINGTNPVPEPGTFALMGLGAVGLGVFAYRRRARKQAA